jgi:drug/metabolite transporter (DMT)-like permease
VLAALVLREQVGPRRWAGVLVGMVGALIIIRPGGEIFSLASLLPLGAAFLYASYSIATRMLNADESPMTTLVYSAALGSVVASILAPFHWTTPTLTDAAMMLSMGIFGGVGHYVLIVAFTYASASALAPFNYTSLIWATLLGFVVFGDLPDQWTLFGASLIVAAGVYVWWRERVRRGEQ